MQIDKGENLSNLIKKLPLAERKKIARQLIEQFKSNPNRGDIKIGNILYDCISQKAYFIDDKSMMFSYTTQSANSSGHYEERKSDDKELIKQQLLGLTIILYQLLNGYDGHDILGTMPQLNFLYEGGFLASVVQSTEKSKTYKYYIEHIQKHKNYTYLMPMNKIKYLPLECTGLLSKELQQAYESELSLEELITAFEKNI